VLRYSVRVIAWFCRWGRPETHIDHAARHAADFGIASWNIVAYALTARSYLRAVRAEGYLVKLDPRTSALRIYDPITNTFAAFNADRTTATIYKPSPTSPSTPHGHRYPTNFENWRAQPGVEMVGRLPPGW
jgi:pyocin large subunit-like protein